MPKPERPVAHPSKLGMLSLIVDSVSRRAAMTPVNLVARARDGETDAIAHFLNHRLNPKGVTAQVIRKASALQILLEANTVPEPETSCLSVQEAIVKLGIQSIQSLEIYGRQQGETQSNWVRHVSLPLAQNDPSSPDQPLPDQLPSAQALRPGDFNIQPIGFSFKFWLQWQLANLKGGLLLLFVVWIALNFITYILQFKFGQETGETIAPGLILTSIFVFFSGGLFIGDSQAYYIKEYIENPNSWRWATFGGFFVGGIVNVVIQLIGYVITSFLLLSLFPIAILSGVLTILLGGCLQGLILGMFQSLVLNQQVSHSTHWMSWSTVAGAISFLLGAMATSGSAVVMVMLLNDAGFGIADISGATLVFGLLFGVLATWFSYHAITGLRMSRFLQELKLQQF